MDKDDILERLDSTELSVELKELEKIYLELENRQKKFCDLFCIHCTSGCGKCCEHFIPDVTEIEADYLAYGLIREGRDGEALKMLSGYHGEACPFYVKEDTHHCTVYPYRALVCRLFEASASEDKDGEPVFRNCKYNHKIPDVTTAMMEQHPDDVVEMGEYGIRVDEIRSDEEEKKLITEALPGSIEKIRLLLELEDESRKNS